MADRVGQQLGNYQLVRLLGQGGFAEVYQGTHIYLDTPAAIKVLRTELADEDAGHFKAEARTIARLIHPNIVRVLEFGVQETVPFLVMDYAPNGTVRKRYPRGVVLPLSTVVSYVDQIADALQYAHDQKVVHRDVKPENLLLGRRNEVLISDFGIALVTGSRYQTTQNMQELVGTIAYMAPEQIQSKARNASDQYALGIVVYEWLCGTRPFHGSFTEIAVKHALVPPPPLREQVPAIPASVEAVVMKALAKDPEQRFACIRDFAAALKQAYEEEPSASVLFADARIAPYPSHSSAATMTFSGQEEEVPLVPVDVSVELDAQSNMTTPISDAVPVSLVASSVSKSEPLPETPASEPELPSETPTSLVPPGRMLSRRNLLIGAAGVVAASAMGAGLAWLVRTQEPHKTIVPPTTSTGAVAPLYVYHGHSGPVWSVARSPDGSRVVSGSSDKTVQVWNTVDGGSPYIYTGHSDSVYAVAWSLNGKRIASASYDTTVQVWDAEGGHPYTYSGHSTWVWSVAWSPDSKRIVSAGGDKTVQVWDAANGKLFYTYTGHTGPVYTVAWSPDGKHVASAGTDGTAQVWDATSGVLLYTYQLDGALIWSVAWSPDSKRIASASSNKTVQVWDAANGDHLYIYYGHSDFVYTVAWSPDGKRIASAGDDKTVQVWDATDGSSSYTYNGHTSGVRSVAWLPDGKHIVSGSQDKTVQVWQAGQQV